ncbi:MAG: hypothetical protein FWC09_01840 [Lachnospiraceae bacterium]|nr:hypothetical protein [Lachnospiraceae bacterium]
MGTHYNDELKEKKNFFKYPSKNTVIFFIFIIIIIIVGPIRYSEWNRYMASFDPYLNSEKLIQTSTVATHKLSPNYRHRTYHDTLGSGYQYKIELPKYLKFNYGIIRIRNNSNDLWLTIFMRSQTYVISLKGYGSAVDKNGNPLGRNPKNSEASYERWLLLYDTYYEQIMEMFEIFREVFGEDVLQ